MGKKKAELEDDATSYYSKVEEMRRAHDRRDYHGALGFAAAAWEYVDGMMQFERRFEDKSERKSLDCVDYVLRYAPLLFDVQTLSALSSLLRTQKRVDKNTAADLAANLERAYLLMNEAHQLWDHLERNVQVDQDKLRGSLGGDQDRWRWLAEKWHSMGIIQRAPSRGSYILSLLTRMESEVRAKCSACGVVAKAAKGRFWEQILCPKCKATVYFIILLPENS